MRMNVAIIRRARVSAQPDLLSGYQGVLLTTAIAFGLPRRIYFNPHCRKGKNSTDFTD